MKKTIGKKIYGIMLIASFALVITSCQKEQNANFKNNNEEQGKFNTTGNGMPEITTCSPIPDSLAVPEGNKLFLQTFARGVQIYEIQRSATDPGNLVWVNIAPKAALYTKPDFVNQIIDHFAGPSWQFIKGPFKNEKVVAKKVKGSTQDPLAIQWLLLKADDALSTPGNPVTFIQRICTVEGLAPTTIPAGAQVGQLDSIPYKASYLFYTRN
jgi:Protein of unknown function (DUF3455)